jgi:hypothetical protein
MSATVQAELEKELRKQEEKYFNLVWYARSHNRDDLEYWDTVPHDIRRGAFNAQLDVETRYPEEVGDLCSGNSDWQHGFNSGALAAFRFILTALDDEMMESDCDGELIPRGGLQNALEEFPFLDT